MIDLLKKLIERRKEDVTILLFDDENPHQQESYSLHPGKLFFWIGGLNLLIVLLVSLIFYVTPLGTLIFNKEDRAMRSTVMDVGYRINALQDSLNARDRQLHEIQQVLRENSDTTFSTWSSDEWDVMYGSQQQEQPEMNDQPARQQRTSIHVTELAGIQPLQSDQIIHSEIFSGNITFPADAPVQGSLTGNYNPEKGHYGIDIASRKGADVRSVADGVVISSDWSINNGYVMHIIHGDGIVTIYKHFSEISYKVGDVVRKGDIIGKVGETGILASGPHIHFEIWKNGASLDPIMYINLY